MPMRTRSPPRRRPVHELLPVLVTVVALIAGVVVIQMRRTEPAAAARAGTRAFIALMCKFSDNTNAYGFTSTDIDTMFNGTPYGLNTLVKEM